MNADTSLLVLDIKKKSLEKTCKNYASIETVTLKVRLLMPILLRHKRNSALSLLVILALGLGLLVSVKMAAHASGQQLSRFHLLLAHLLHL